MEEILYNTLTSYYKALAIKGYIEDVTVFKIFVTDFIQELLGEELRCYLTKIDIRLMQDLLYQFFGSTCEISLPPDCECCCPEGDNINPSITGFSLIPSTTSYTGSQTVSFTGAKMIINPGNKELVVDSLKIYWGSTVMQQGLPVENNVTFGPISESLTESNTYTAKASVMDTEGVEWFSNLFTIQCKVSPVVKSETMYYGNTDIIPQTFDDMSVTDIMALVGTTPKVITGLSDTTFIIHQEDKIHYLLIPDTVMDLVHAEYGTTLVTTLWDGSDGAYRLDNPGGTHNGIHYKVFFLYSPIGAFPEDIRVTVRNK